MGYAAYKRFVNQNSRVKIYGEEPGPMDRIGPGVRMDPPYGGYPNPLEGVVSGRSL